jgi:hypothetical protein
MTGGDDVVRFIIDPSLFGEPTKAAEPKAPESKAKPDPSFRITGHVSVPSMSQPVLSAVSSPKPELSDIVSDTAPGQISARSPKKHRTRITFCMDAKLLAELEDMARETHQTASEIVRDIIKRELARNQKCQLYRHWDKDGVLLYVGQSLSAVARLSQHRQSPWFHEISKVTVETFPNIKEAMAAEARAVVDENPKYNIVGRRARSTPAILG